MKENNSNAISRGQWLGVLGLMVVVGLLAGVIGNAVTGNVVVRKYPSGLTNVYTKTDIDNKNFTTNQDILNMLSNCEVYSRHINSIVDYNEDGRINANDVCYFYNSICLLTEVGTLVGGQIPSNGFTRLTTCGNYNLLNDKYLLIQCCK